MGPLGASLDRPGPQPPPNMREVTIGAWASWVTTPRELPPSYRSDLICRPTTSWMHSVERFATLAHIMKRSAQLVPEGTSTKRFPSSADAVWKLTPEPLPLPDPPPSLINIISFLLKKRSAQLVPEGTSTKRFFHQHETGLAKFASHIHA